MFVPFWFQGGVGARESGRDGGPLEPCCPRQNCGVGGLAEAVLTSVHRMGTGAAGKCFLCLAQ